MTTIPMIIDLETNTITKFEMNGDYDISAIPILNKPTNDNNIMPLDVFGTDTRYQVPNTLISPYSAICRLDSYNSYDNDHSVATATLISKNIAITAAHTIYKTDLGGVFHDITVSPGYYGGNTPYGTSTVTTIILPQEWIDNNASEYTSVTDEAQNYDWAILILDTSLGIDSGWLQYLSYSGADYVNLTGISARIIGYPNYVQGLNRYTNYLYQFVGSGKIDTSLSKRLEYTIDTSPGDSGAPILNSNNQIIGVHGGTRYNNLTNRGVRIYPDMNQIIINAIGQYSL